MICPHCQSEVVDDARFCGACGKAASATESAPGVAYLGGDVYAAMIGKEIAGRYRVVKKLGEGGMGAVFRAEQISLKRACAVKLLRPGLAANQQMLRRFNAEAEAVAKLSHPNTVNIYDFGQDTDGTLFIAMEYVEGQSLRDVLQQQAPLPIGRALAIASQIAASLTDAHAQGIIHRDLKPDNVMLSERGKQKDVVRVLDFGIAKLRDDSRQGAAMTQAGDMLGTPQYMAPEQIKGEPIDGRADVYALGCLLFEMVTGRICFEAPTIMGMLSKHLVDEADAPSTRRPDLQIPPAFDQLVLAALAKEPPARPATMEVYGEQITAMFQALPPDQRRAITSGVMAAPMAATGGPATGFAPPTPPPMGLAPTGFGGVGPTAIVGPPSAMVPIAASPVGTPLPASALGSGVQPLGAPTTMPPGTPTSMPGATTTTAAKNRSMLYVIIGVVVLLIVVGIVMTRGDKAGKQARNPVDRIDHGHRADPAADDDDVVDPPGGDDDDVDEAKLRKQMEDLERLGDELRKHQPADDN